MCNEQICLLAPRLREFERNMDDARRLDVHFRLMREDLVQPLREEDTVFARLYPILAVLTVELVCTDRNAVGLRVTFVDPCKEKSKAGIESWWEVRRQKWFQRGSLVKLQFANATFFAEVVDRTITDLLAVNGPSIVVRPAEDDGFGSALGYNLAGGSIKQASLSFFTYKPVLRALQQIVELPFNGRLGAYRDRNALAEAPPPPRFVAHNGQRFNLSGLARTPVDKPALIEFDIFAAEALARVQRLTTLDETQFLALRQALMSEVGIVQGPPGTGKSFVGAAVVRVLMDTFGTLLGPMQL